MSAHLLRQAADILREEAQAATPGVWKTWGMSVMADQDGTSNVATAADVARTLYRDEKDRPRTFDADYIATMQPRIGLALADWLDTAGGDLWAYGPLHCESGCFECDDDLWVPHVRRALTLARLIVGGAS